MLEIATIGKLCDREPLPQIISSSFYAHDKCVVISQDIKALNGSGLNA